MRRIGALKVERFRTVDRSGETLQIRLRERVREELGGTYSIGIGASASDLPDHEYRITAWFSSDPERADELFEEVPIGVDWAREGAEQMYLNTAKEILRSNREEQFRGKTAG